MSFKHVLGGIVGAGLTGAILMKGATYVPVHTPPKVPPSDQKLDPSSFFKYGFPGPVHDLQTHDGFITCYDRKNRHPYWVVEHITAESLGTSVGSRRRSHFKEDEAIPEMFRARLKDYFRSGYDRGHMVPAADMKVSQHAMDETFYLTNMSPQVGDGFNRDYWARFEGYCRNIAKKHGSMYIVTGPLYLPRRDPVDGKFKVTYEVIGNPPNIAVPTHFFKLLVVDDGQLSATAFVLPNQPIKEHTNLAEFEVPINALERSTGLRFLQSAKYDKLIVEPKLFPPPYEQLKLEAGK